MVLEIKLFSGSIGFEEVKGFKERVNIKVWMGLWGVDGI